MFRGTFVKIFRVLYQLLPGAVLVVCGGSAAPEQTASDTTLPAPSGTIENTKGPVPDSGGSPTSPVNTAAANTTADAPTMDTESPESILRYLHPWTGSRPGAWKRCIVITETRDENGKPLLTSTRENRITLEAFEPIGARLRIESNVALASSLGSVEGGYQPPGPGSRTFSDPHPRIVIEPFIPGLPNIPVTDEPTVPATTGTGALPFPSLPEPMIPFIRRFPERPIVPSPIRQFVPPLVRLVPSPTDIPGRSGTTGTTVGDPPGVSLRFEKPRYENLDVSGRMVRCTVTTVRCEDVDRRIVSDLYYNLEVSPYLFRRNTAISDRSTGKIISRQALDVMRLDKPVVLYRDEPPRALILTRMMETTDDGETTSYLLSQPDVPGQVVRYTVSQKNAEGRIVSLVSMILADFGQGKGPATPPSPLPTDPTGPLPLPLPPE